MRIALSLGPGCRPATEVRRDRRGDRPAGHRVQDAGHEVLLFKPATARAAAPKAWVRERAVPEYIGQSFVEVHHLLYAYDLVADFDIIHNHTIVGPVIAESRAERRVVTTNHGPFTNERIEIQPALRGTRRSSRSRMTRHPGRACPSRQ
jgi:hypothetical protein